MIIVANNQLSRPTTSGMKSSGFLWDFQPATADQAALLAGQDNHTK